MGLLFNSCMDYTEHYTRKPHTCQKAFLIFLTKCALLQNYNNITHTRVSTPFFIKTNRFLISEKFFFSFYIIYLAKKLIILVLTFHFFHVIIKKKVGEIS